MSKITTIGLGIPDRAYSQEYLFKAIGHRMVYWNIFEKSGIKERHLCLDPKDMVKTTAQDQADNYKKFAVELSIKSAQDCLKKAQVRPEEIDLIVFCSCTGFMCEGPEHSVAKALGMRDDVILEPLVGMGCGASVPALRRADDFIRLNPQSKALCIATEISNACYHPKSDNMGVILGNAIFADGSACALVEGISPRKSLNILQHISLHDYQNMGKIGMEFCDSRIRLVLCNNAAEITVPLVIRAVEKLSHDLLTLKTNADKVGNILGLNYIKQIVLHSGGASILREAQKALKIDREMLKHSYHTWENYGNMSSPTTLFGIEHLLSSNEMKKDDYILIISLGAGIDCDGILAYYS